jgi:WD40 repeat protein
MAFAPDDSALFTGDGHGTIRTAVLTNGVVSSLGAVPGEIDSLEVGPDGQTVFVSTGTYVLSVDSRTGKYRWTSLSRYKYRMYSMAFAPRVNAVIAVDGLGNVQQLSLDPPPTTPVAVPNHAGGIDHTGAIYFNIKLGQDGDMLGFVGMDHVAIERLGRKQSVLSLDIRQIQDERRSPLFAFAREAAVAAGRTGVLVWDLKSGIPARYIPIPGTKWLGISADGAKLATATDNSIDVLDLGTRNRIATLPLHLTGRRMPVVMAFSPDGTRLAWSDGPEGTHVATLQPGGAATALPGLKNIYCLAFDRSGRLLGAGAEDGKLRVWDLGSSGNPLTLFPGHDRGVISVAFDRTGGRVATGGADGRIKIWDLSKPAAQPTVLEAGSLPVTSVAFRRDGSVIAVNDSWDTEPFVLHRMFTSEFVR